VKLLFRDEYLMDKPLVDWKALLSVTTMGQQLAAMMAQE
jgi:hypothetical protein